MKLVDEQSTSFVYAVSIKGLTGGALGTTGDTSAYLQKASTRNQKSPYGWLRYSIGRGRRAAVEYTDGFIVGNAVINEVEKLWKAHGEAPRARYEGMTAFVRSLCPQ